MQGWVGVLRLRMRWVGMGGDGCVLFYVREEGGGKGGEGMVSVAMEGFYLLFAEGRWGFVGECVSVFGDLGRGGCG